MTTGNTATGNLDGSANTKQYPQNFSCLTEGDTDPILGKKIQVLIESDDDFIVYLDQELYVWWNTNDNELVNQHGDELTRVAVLESVQVDHLSSEQKSTFRRLVAEGVARLCEGNKSAAALSFDKAEEWIHARSQERARLWYLTGAVAIAIPLAIASAAMLFDRVELRSLIGVSAFDVMLGGCLGAIGAWMSVIQRTRKTDLDISAGRTLHWVEGATRIVTGALGATLFALGIKANLVLGSVKSEYAFPSLLVFTVVAGLSERLVPSFVEQVEASARPPTRNG
jgi:hypothetical protein